MSDGLTTTKPAVRIMTIDPECARRLLAMNVANRPLSKSRVVLLVKKMKAGEWALTGQSHVIVSREGRLLNGQHTLTAVVESGVTITTVVVTGIDPAVFSKIDIGMKRTSGQILAVGGVVNATLVGALVRVVEQYDSLIRQVGGVWSTRTTIEADEIASLLALDRDAFLESGSVGKAVAAELRKSGLTFPGTVPAALHYLAVRDGHNPDDVMVFMGQVGTDIGHAPNSPELSLRRWIGGIARGLRSGNGGRNNLILLSVWIKAYLAAEQGRTLQKMYVWTPESPEYPRL